MSEAVLDIPEPYRTAHHAAFRNRAHLEASRFVGCFYCGMVYGAKTIKEWVDDGETALCPLCGIDSVVPVTEAQIGSDFLAKMHEYWFGNKVSLRP